MQSTETDVVLKEVLEVLEQATRQVRALLRPAEPPKKRLVYDFNPDGSFNFHFEEESLHG